MSKITMTTPLVEMDGDEMTRILWQMIKDELLTPFIDLKTEYYDLGLEERNRTDDQVTVESAKATMKYGVAVLFRVLPHTHSIREGIQALMSSWQVSRMQMRSCHSLHLRRSSCMPR